MVRKSHSWVLILYWVSDSRTDIPNHHRKLFPKTLWKDRIQKQKTKQTNKKLQLHLRVEENFTSL